MTLNNTITETVQEMRYPEKLTKEFKYRAYTKEWCGFKSE
jgi:hypothetical protein